MFHLTVEFAEKLAPLTVMVKAEAPATTLAGESEQIAGALVEEAMKLTAGEKISLPPPVKVNTLTPLQPAVRMSAAVICAVSCVELTNAVVRGLPLKATTEPEVVGLFTLGEIKFEPFTVSVNAGPLGLAVAGLTLAIRGVFVCVGKIVNGAALLVIPPPGSGFDTVTSEVPGVATSEARTVMAICPVFILTEAERAEPFQNAVEVPVDPAMKPVPAMNMVKPWLPAVTLDGKRPVMIGVGFGWPGATVLPLLELQLDVTIVSTPSIMSAVHRKRIKAILL